MGLEKIRQIVRQYWVVTLLPTCCALAIYSDWNHTRLWKKKLAEEAKLKLPS